MKKLHVTLLSQEYIVFEWFINRMGLKNCFDYNVDFVVTSIQYVVLSISIEQLKILSSIISNQLKQPVFNEYQKGILNDIQNHFYHEI